MTSPGAPSPVTSCVRMSFVVMSAPPSAARAGVRQQRHLARVLDGAGDLALLLDGHAGDATRTDLAAVGDELPQGRDVLVVDPVLQNGTLDRLHLLDDRLRSEEHTSELQSRENLVCR